MSKSNKSTKLKPEIGKIVSLKTHYIRGASEILDQIYISGDDKSIPPFMMITECLKETKDKFDSDTGEKILGNDSYNFKVQWFNTSKYEISETWINSSLLEEVLIKNNIEENKENSDLSFKKGDRVILKTNALELQKKRTSIKLEESRSNIKTSSVVSFCAPEMIVMSKVAFKPKKPVKDSITGDTIRFYPNNLLKCKYYNPYSDKYSEILLPKECFEKADSEIESLEEILDPNSVILSKNKLLQVSNVSYLHGVYMAYCKNFVDGSEESFRLNEIMPFKLLDKKKIIGSKIAPLWKDNKYYSIKDYCKDIKYEKNEFSKYYYIEYKNQRNQFTKRFISIKNIENIEKEVNKKTMLIGFLVNAHCFLRNAERTFTFTDERLFAIHHVKENKPLKENSDTTLKNILVEEESKK